MTQPTSKTRFAVLFFTDIVGSTDLKVRYGVPAYSEALRIHNDHFERIAGECHGILVRQNTGDGYFAEAGGVAEAVRFALLFQDAMRAGPWSEVRLTTRVGIHAGEVAALDSQGGSGIVAPAADLAARVMSLAVGGQILLTRFPFDEARHFLREHPAVAGGNPPPLRWLAHGPYLLKGRDEPIEIFEVGAEGLAPLTPPPDGDKAKRAIRPGEEETLGWRPAIGLEIPGRPDWRLTGKLGAGGFGEVWTGEHTKLHQRRAFKFCFDDERLRALKREVTLVRLLRTALGDREDIVRFHELKLDEPPFYLESDLAPHGNLLQWAEKQGGLAAIPLAQRIALVAHTATALAAAHSIGVLHKDIKPTNILVFDGPDGTARPRLVDFGIGTLADPAVLGQHGVTAAGFTRATIEHSTGTPTYSPPEYLAGKPYTVQGDIYGLGVLLYQLLTADSSRPIAPGWERDITDPLLREDIAACVDGDPARRLPSAADLADRLLHLDQRRAAIAEQELLARDAAARAASEAAAVVARIRAARLHKLAASFAVLALLAIAGGVFAWVNQRKADAARHKAQVAEESAQILAELRRLNNQSLLMAQFAAGLGEESAVTAALGKAEKLALNARSLADKLGRTRPEQVGPLTTLAYIQLQKKNPDQAEKTLKHALTLLPGDDPDATSANMLLFALLTAQDRTNEADAILEHALPDFAQKAIKNTQQAMDNARTRALSASCVINLKQIALALKIWADDHENKFPFTVTRADGGTLELCSRGKEGFEKDPVPHFLVISNELFTPRILTCPADPKRTPAPDFLSLTPTNVTYQVFSGADCNPDKTNQVMIFCPIHGNAIDCSGAIKVGNPE
jgi:serine/threonine protein kinase/class 3 adenylate cyclase